MPDQNGDRFWWELPGATVATAQARPQDYVQYYSPSFIQAMLEALPSRQTALEPIPQEVDSEVDRIKLINDFKVGADPEWIMLGPKGELVQADIPAHGRVGTDHGGRIMELRPTPSRSCLRLVQNMARLLNLPCLERWRGARWRAGGLAKYGSRNESLGGHVHLGLSFTQAYHRITPKQLRDALTTSYTYAPIRNVDAILANHARSEAAIEALDALTLVYENLDILPQKEATGRRRAGGYGALGDVRESDGHLEYRTPVSWLFNPRTAYFILTGYKLAAAEPASFAVKGGWNSLADWISRFASKDNDAARVTEKFTSLPAVQGDPDRDFKELWADPKLADLK